MPRLEAYIAGHCLGCEYTRELCAEASARFPHFSVRLIDLDVHPLAKPADVIAVPAFLLDGEVVFLGNPSATELFARLAAALDGAGRSQTHGKS